jgi:type I restriction enzyme S subunit
MSYRSAQGKWDIPQSWVWTELGEVANVIGGGTPRTDDPQNFQDGDIPWITPADLSGYKQKFISKGARSITAHGLANSGARMLPAGTVLFSSRAPIGYVVIAANALSTNQGFKSFILPEGVSSDYVYYYLQRAKDLALELASGTTFLEISGTKAALIPVPLAPRPEQNRIVGEIEKQFTRLDDAVAALKRVQSNLKRYRASVLKVACEGRLVPTEAELAHKEGRHYEPASELLKRMLVERRAKWEADQFQKMTAGGKPPKNDHWKQKYKEPQQVDSKSQPRLPDGWAWATLEQVTDRVTDGTHLPPPFGENGIPFVFVQHLVGGVIRFENTKFISKEVYGSLNARCPVEKGDVLYTAVGSYGVAVEIETDKPFSFQRHIAHLHGPRILAKYLTNCLNSPMVLAQAHREARGVAQKTVTLGSLAKFLIPVPPLEEQSRIAAAIEKIEQSLKHLLAEIPAHHIRATRLRQSILLTAFSGQLVVQDATDEPAGELLEGIRAAKNGTQGVFDFNAMPKKPAVRTTQPHVAPKSAPRSKKAGAP